MPGGRRPLVVDAAPEAIEADAEAPGVSDEPADAGTLRHRARLGGGAGSTDDAGPSESVFGETPAGDAAEGRTAATEDAWADTAAAAAPAAGDLEVDEAAWAAAPPPPPPPPPDFDVPGGRARAIGGTFGGLSGPAVPEQLPELDDQAEERQPLVGGAGPRRGDRRRRRPVAVRPPPLSASGRHLRLVLPVAAALVARGPAHQDLGPAGPPGRPHRAVWTLQFNLTFNTGAAFSRFPGLGPYIGILAAVVAVGLLWSGRTVPNSTGAVAVGLIFGGAVGNLLDRAFRAGDGFLGGGVVDFIDVQWYPIFNVADIGVVLGALLLLFATARYGDGARRRTPRPRHRPST